MKAIKWILSILFIFSIIVVVGIVHLRSSLPKYSGTRVVVELGHNVDVIRDSFGMPHIYARSDRDVYFTLGFSQAQDRLFQMDLARRAGTGRLAEIFGESFVKIEKIFRTIGIGIPKSRWFQYEISPESRESLQAFADGVNYFLENNRSPLPIEFMVLGYEPDPWLPEDSIAVMMYLGFSQNYAFKTELLHASIIDQVGETLARELYIEYPSGYPAIIPEGENPMAEIGIEFFKTLDYAGSILDINGGASNGWVVAPQKSASGNALFSNDPHLSLSAPSVWYEAHLTTPSVNVSGAFVPGLPFAFAGANEHIAWGVTNSHHDDADFYLEKLKPD